jgi:hypothetical protein
MVRKVIALSARAAAQLPSIPETQRQLKAGYLEGSTRIDIRELEVMKRDYVFAIVTTHDRWEVIEVLEKLGLSPYCPSDHIIVSPKGKRQDIDHWRRWRAQFEETGGLLAAVIDHTGSGNGSVVHALGTVPDFTNVNRYFWPYDSDDRTSSNAIRIDRLSDTYEYKLSAKN